MPLHLTTDQIAHYHSKGFLLIHDVIPRDNILHIREIFLEAFKNNLWQRAPYSNETIINDIYSYFPEIIHLLYPSGFFDVIKDLLGNDIVWVPECSMHRNRYIHWHKDTSIQELNGEYSHCNYKEPLLQVAIYFQDNDEYGGGLTVISYSHTEPDRFYKMLDPSFVKKLYYKLIKIIGRSVFHDAENRTGKQDVPTTAGSLLVFDMRIDHRSTFATKQDTKIDKLAIFNTFGRDNEVTKGYFDFMKHRPEPYYRYFQEKPLPDIVYKKGLDNNVTIWY